MVFLYWFLISFLLVCFTSLCIFAVQIFLFVKFPGQGSNCYLLAWCWDSVRSYFLVIPVAVIWFADWTLEISLFSPGYQESWKCDLSPKLGTIFFCEPAHLGFLSFTSLQIYYHFVNKRACCLLMMFFANGSHSMLISLHILHPRPKEKVYLQ